MIRMGRGEFTMHTAVLGVEQSPPPPPQCGHFSGVGGGGAMF